MDTDSQNDLQSNVVWIAALNPLTREKELRIEFAKYGTILKCELIRDPSSGLLAFFFPSKLSRGQQMLRLYHNEHSR
jgi:hypothetical protein